jgi:hypothetical protein
MAVLHLSTRARPAVRRHSHNETPTHKRVEAQDADQRDEQEIVQRRHARILQHAAAVGAVAQGWKSHNVFLRARKPVFSPTVMYLDYRSFFLKKTHRI